MPHQRLTAGRGPTLALLMTAVLVAGCQAAPAASVESMDPSPSVQPPSSEATCPDTELLTPNGDRVNLTGEWKGDWFSIPPSSGQRTFALQVGDCVWMSISDDQFRASPTTDRSLLAQFIGRLRADFTVAGEVVTLFRWVDPFTFGDQPIRSPISFRLEPDDAGDFQLVEDREPGVEGPRCPNPTMWCPAPTVLVRVGGTP